MAFSLPNTITNGQSGDATAVQQNFDYLLSTLNTSAILKDGSVAMDQPLALAGNPVSALQAAPKQYVDSATPLGAVIMYGGTTAPSSQWLLCRGQAVSRSTYAGLFAIVGTAYGVGDGSTTFNVPNYQGSLPVGHNSGVNAPSGIGGAFNLGVGQRFGSTDAIVVSHSHPINVFTGVETANHVHSGTTGNNSVDHTHVVRGAADNSSGGGFGEGNVVDYSSGSFGPLANTSGASANHTHAFSTSGVSANHQHAINSSTDAAGSSATFANYPPCQSVNFIIKSL